MAEREKWVCCLLLRLSADFPMLPNKIFSLATADTTLRVIDCNPHGIILVPGGKG